MMAAGIEGHESSERAWSCSGGLHTNVCSACLCSSVRIPWARMDPRDGGLAHLLRCQLPAGCGDGGDHGELAKESVVGRSCDGRLEVR